MGRSIRDVEGGAVQGTATEVRGDRKMKANRRWMRWVLVETADDALDLPFGRILRRRRALAA